MPSSTAEVLARLTGKDKAEKAEAEKAEPKAKAKAGAEQTWKDPVFCQSFTTKQQLGQRVKGSKGQRVKVIQSLNCSHRRHLLHRHHRSQLRHHHPQQHPRRHQRRHRQELSRSSADAKKKVEQECNMKSLTFDSEKHFLEKQRAIFFRIALLPAGPLSRRFLGFGIGRHVYLVCHRNERQGVSKKAPPKNLKIKNAKASLNVLVCSCRKRMGELKGSRNKSSHDTCDSHMTPFFMFLPQTHSEWTSR